MTIAVSADEHMPLIDVLLAELDDRGYHSIYFGPKRDETAQDWPEVTLAAATAVVNGRADEGIVLCWTGTGASIAANKVKGIRAALCEDAVTAKGARSWNHANVLALSLRKTSEALLKEILDSWFGTPFSEDEWNLDQVRKVKQIEEATS